MSDIRSSSSSFTSEIEKSYWKVIYVSQILESSETQLFLHVQEEIKKFYLEYRQL